MPRGYFSEHDYRRAYNVMYGEWLPLSPCDCQEEFKLNANTPDPERLLLKKEAFENLSEEAKEIINTILYSSSEALELLKTPKKKLLTKGSVAKYFFKKWHSRFITELTIREIQRWLKQL